MNMPVWLEKTEYSLLPQAATRRRRADYLEKTLADVQKTMAEELDYTASAVRPGLLQQLNPRVKLVGMAFVLLAVALTGSLTVLVIIHGLLLLAALSSRIGWKAYLLRTWLPAVLFTGLTMLPGIFNWFTPGQPLVIIYQGLNWHVGPVTLPAELTITMQGLTVATLVLLRSAASLGVAVLLVKTTRWPVLTKALAGLGLPGLFVTVLDLTYRYLFLFLLLLSEYLWGRQSRLAGRERTGAKWEWIGGAVAGFLRLAGEYSREITASMQARGYNGSNHQVLVSRIGMADIWFFALTVLLLAATLGGTQLVRIHGV